jgi:surface polysaccharide O-acyltransferase-like enzyme
LRASAQQNRRGLQVASEVKSGYRRSLDLAPLIAYFGIVWDPARALALFLMLTSFLAIGPSDRNGGRQGSQSFWISRARCIAVPLLFCCVIYRVIFEIVSDEPFQYLSDPLTILIGPFIHPWFLPFVMLTLPLIPIISLSVQSLRQLAVACAALVVVSLPLGLLHAEIGIAGWFYDVGLFHPPLPQWIFSLPLFLYGAIAAVAHRLGRPEMAVAAAACVSIPLLILRPKFASPQMLLVALLFEAPWRWNLKGTWPTTFNGAAFGIYIVHPAGILAAFKIFGSGIDRSIVAIFAFALCWALILVLQRLPVLRSMA